MLKRIATRSALAASLLAVLSTAALAQPNGRRPVAPLDLDALPWEDSGPERQSQPEARTLPETKSAPKLQAPGASAYTAPDASSSSDLESIAGEIRSRLTNVLSGSRGTHPDDSAGLAAFYNARNNIPIWTTGSGLSQRAARAMTEIRRAGDWGLEASAYPLPEPDGAEPSPSDLADSEIKLSLAVLKYARHARGGRIDYSEAVDLVDEKSNIYEPKSVLQAIAAAESSDAFLRGLHPRHEGFLRLREALLGLDKATSSAPDDTRHDRDKPRPDKKKTSTPADERQRIIINMERWRLIPEDLGDFYVWNSVTEQYTRVFDHGKMILKEKIVVGKPKSPTPMFSAKMQYVVFHPEWGVPDSIKVNELLPKLREASDSGDYADEGDNGPLWFRSSSSRRVKNGGAADVLDRMNLKVKIEGREIDPDTVDWGSVDIRRYMFVQPSGDRNVLGLVKFRFPNKHDVYMHDTPEKKLFGSAQRTFSHGCMRTQNPVHLAEVVLNHDRNWAPEYIKQVLGEEPTKPKEIKLNNPIPVHVTYFTMALDDDGKLRTLPDIYGVDKMMSAALNGEPFRFSLKSQAQVAEANPPRNSDYRDDPRDGRPRDDRYSDRNADRYSDRSSDRNQDRDPEDSYDRRRYRDRGDSEDTWSSGRWNRLDSIFGR